MNSVTETVVTIATAIVGVAILSVLVSRNSNTPAVLQAAGSAFSNALTVATGPVTGQTAPAVLDYPSSGQFSPGFNLPNFRGAL